MYVDIDYIVGFNMQILIKVFFSPLLFGFAFFGPLIAQSLTALAVELPVSNLIVGLTIGTAMGLMAQLRGSWIWVR